MKYFFALIVTSLLFFFHPSSVAVAQQDLVKALEEDNITVYKKKSDHSRHFTVHFEVRSTPKRVKKLLSNPSTYKQWVDQIMQIKTIDQVNDTLQYVWVLVGVKNILTRQGVVKMTTINQPGSKDVRINQELDKNHSYREGEYEQIKGFNTRWDLQKMGFRRVKIELTVIGNKEDRAQFVDNLLDKLLTNQLYALAVDIRDHF